MTTEEHHDLLLIAQNRPWDASKNLKAYLATITPETPENDKISPNKGNRTVKQNAAIHTWLELLAGELDRAGHTIQDVVARIKRAEIRPTKTALKEVLWRPYQQAALGKDSTTELTKQEIDVVYEGLNKFLGQEFHIHIPFPSHDTRNLMIEAVEMAKKLDYPDEDYSPNI